MMLAILTGFFLSYGDAHLGWWVLYWAAFFFNLAITFVISVIQSQK